MQIGVCFDERLLCDVSTRLEKKILCCIYYICDTVAFGERYVCAS